MILCLLVALTVIVASGAAMQTNAFFGSSRLEELHVTSVHTLLALVALHVLGVMLSSWFHRDDLVRAMFTGRKKAPADFKETTEMDSDSDQTLKNKLRTIEGSIFLIFLVGAGALYGWISTSGRTAVDHDAPAVAAASPSAMSADAAAGKAVLPTSAVTAPSKQSVNPAAPAVAEKPARTTERATDDDAGSGQQQAEPSSRPKGFAAAPARRLPDSSDYATGGPAEGSREWMLSSGGRLYDNWYVALGRPAPQTTHPAWPEANTAVSGAETWRCKSCHGWDYLGKGGQNGSGPHLTGIKGVAGMRKISVEQIAGIFGDATHRITDEMMPPSAKYRLALFLSEGRHPISPYIDPEGHAKGDAAAGRALYQTVCAACHGFDGRTRKLGASAKADYTGTPLFVGTKANANPIEVLHKLRNGHPGAIMVSLRALPMKYAVNVLAYVQTLPKN